MHGPRRVTNSLLLTVQDDGGHRHVRQCGVEILPVVHHTTCQSIIRPSKHRGVQLPQHAEPSCCGNAGTEQCQGQQPRTPISPIP